MPAGGDMHFKTLIAVIMLVWLGACSTPAKPLTPEQVSALPTDVLCWSYAGYASIDKPEARISQATIRAELTKRGMLGEREWQSIDRQAIARGMSRCTVMAIYGKPSESNTTADMEILGFPGISYVMFQNGVVTNYVGAPN
jgi:hypothetical protein